MGFLDKLRGTKYTIRKLLAAGQEAETRSDLEAAFEQYQQAAQLGSADAMVAIGHLYAVKKFRMRQQSNLWDLMRQGIPSFPWNTVTWEEPDYPAALEWYRKAAELDHPLACYLTGCFLCDGTGGSTDIPAGLSHLEKAHRLGIEDAQKMLCLFRDPVPAGLTDAEYEALLSTFTQAVDSGDPSQYELYAQLRGGTEKQLSRLGFILVAARNLQDPKYGLFKYQYTASGIPLIPACTKRANWQSFVRIDLNALPAENTWIAFSSDIDTDFTLGTCYCLKKAGTARYRSPAFGWLGEEKHALLLTPDQIAVPDPAVLDDIIRNFQLLPEEYAAENAAFFTECGEKEYSVEIAAITGSRVDILLRYTIGGSETVARYFHPELLSLDLS